MPQMAPMNWALLFIYFNLILAVFFSKLHYG